MHVGQSFLLAVLVGTDFPSAKRKRHIDLLRHFWEIHL
jgi:hypothetical protein